MAPTDDRVDLAPDTEAVDRQHSAGGLVVKAGQILLISTQYGRRWQLPKGHLEPGETSRQAAEREVLEETGIRGRTQDLLGHIEFDFRSRAGLRIQKTVDYYLFDFVEGSTRNYARGEVSGARWFSWADGIARLTFDNERKLVVEARSLLDRRAQCGSPSST